MRTVKGIKAPMNHSTSFAGTLGYYGHIDGALVNGTIYIDVPKTKVIGELKLEFERFNALNRNNNMRPFINETIWNSRKHEVSTLAKA